MRALPILLLTLSAACTDGANHMGNPLAAPMTAFGAAVGNATNGARRGEVEIFVKTHHPVLIADIRAGGGPILTAAYDLANVPTHVRASQTLRLQSDLALYANNLDALVVAIMVVGA